MSREELLAAYEAKLSEMTNEELFENWDRMVHDQIESELDGWRCVLEEKDDDELFGEEYLDELRAEAIEYRLEAYAEELDEQAGDQ
jgi:hypothetical protein